MLEKESKRLFVAVPFCFDETFAQKYARLRMCTCKMDRVNWVNPSLFHLTLKFLGETNVDRIPIVCKALGEAVKEQFSFDFVLNKVGAFGSRYQPRVLWLGPEEAPNKIFALQHRVEREFSKIGFPSTFGNFVCHLTLARINYIDSKKFFWEQLEQSTNLFSEKVSVKELVLFESILQKGYAPQYVALKKFPLQ